jgi:hypothetical protein
MDLLVALLLDDIPTIYYGTETLNLASDDQVCDFSVECLCVHIMKACGEIVIVPRECLNVHKYGVRVY